MKGIGRLAHFGIGRETSRGVGVAAAFWIPKASLSFDDRVSKAVSDLSYGSIGMGVDAPVTHRHAEGEVVTDMLDKSFGALVYAALGTVQTTGPTDTSAYTHTFSLRNDVQHPSWSLYVVEDNVGQRLHELGMLDELTLECEPDTPVKVTAKFFARASQATVATPSYTTVQNKFLGRHLSFKLASLTSGLAAATKIPIRKLTLTFKKNVVLEHDMGATIEPNDILNQAFSISGKVELDYQGRTYANNMLNATYNAVRIAFTNTEALAGAASVRPSFTLDLSRVHFSEWEVDRKNDDLMVEKWSFEALYDQTNGNIVNSCVLVNGTVSY